MRSAWLAVLALAGLLFAAPADSQSAPAEVGSDLWLETLRGPAVDAWIARENARTQAEVVDTPLYTQLYSAAHEALLTNGSLPSASERGGYVYDIERTRTRTHGLWRRTPVDALIGGAPAWEPILDIDALAAAEKTDWVWQGSSCLPPAHEHCMLTLSAGGSDAATRREFDVRRRAFVKGGFVSPAVKGETVWIDENTLAAAFAGPADSTTAGYPATVRRWSRGQPLASSPVLVQAGPQDIRLSLTRYQDAQGNGGVFVNQEHSFEHRTWWIIAGGRAIKLPLPRDASVVAVHHGELVFGVDTEVVDPVAGPLKAGGLYSVPLGPMQRTGKMSRARIVVEPGPRQALTDVEASRTALLVSMLDEISGKLTAYAFAGGHWTAQSLALPENLNLQIGGVDDRSDIAMVTGEGFLTPRSLYAVDIPSGRISTVATTPAAFNADGMIVEKRQARSRDGTLVPYFVVRREHAPLDGSNPVQVYAYGGFQYSLTPFYSGVTGKLWLERGGIYVQASLRGGGEFGPRWHEAAVRTKRQNAYDDLIAVAEDLIAAGYTSPSRLGFVSGSNGGLLAGVMYNQRPDLWGAIVAGGPLLDMMRYDQLLAGSSWRSEYGDPADPVEGAFLRSISPYHNVDGSRPHPDILLTTSTNDDRVHPSHARRFANKLSGAGLRYLFFENTSGGHSGGAFYEDLARQQALVYAFLSQRLMGPQTACPSARACAPRASP